MGNGGMAAMELYIMAGITDLHMPTVEHCLSMFAQGKIAHPPHSGEVSFAILVSASSELL